MIFFFLGSSSDPSPVMISSLLIGARRVGGKWNQIKKTLQEAQRTQSIEYYDSGKQSIFF